MEQIYTIPVNEAFDASASDPKCGCPLCTLYNQLEYNELDRILGAAMMEPDVRKETNAQGFCYVHFRKMFTMKNRLGLALMMESHLDELSGKVTGGGLFSAPGAKAARGLAKQEESCYVCRRIDDAFSKMVATVFYLWQNDSGFRVRFGKQPYFCLPHYKRLLDERERLEKRAQNDFTKQLTAIEDAYFAKLKEDVSWFCKKFDYRYEAEPWKDSKDAVERTIAFLTSSMHDDKK